MKVSCKIIEDLLPLYVDDVCSDASRELIENHILECESCYDLLNSMKSTKNTSFANKASQLKSLDRKVMKMRIRAIAKGLTIGIGICALLFGLFLLLTEVHIINVPIEKIEISRTGILSDGNIAFHMYINDEYDLNTVRYEVNEDGEMYIMPKRSIIENKRHDDITYGLYNWDYGIQLSPENENRWLCFEFPEDIEPAAIYLGTKNENILIWKNGMTLPAADEAMENYFIEVNTPAEIHTIE